MKILTGMFTFLILNLTAISAFADTEKDILDYAKRDFQVRLDQNYFLFLPCPDQKSELLEPVAALLGNSSVDGAMDILVVQPVNCRTLDKDAKYIRTSNLSVILSVKVVNPIPFSAVTLQDKMLKDTIGKPVERRSCSSSLPAPTASRSNVIRRK